jgi:hypothetical protein
MIPLRHLPPDLAERAGFEPAEHFCSRALQARALGQTTLPLLAYYAADYTTRQHAWQEHLQVQPKTGFQRIEGEIN